MNSPQTTPNSPPITPEVAVSSSAYRCSSCHGPLNAEQRFCPQCGKRIASEAGANRRPRRFLWLLLPLACLIWGTVVLTQPNLLGKAPEKAFSPPRNETPVDPNATPEERASAALQKISNAENPDPQLILDAIDALGTVLKADPKDSWALLNMAELSFERQVFDKAGEFYERYLAINVDDWEVRPRYANALAFSGKLDQALGELDKVLKHDPAHFQALAFKAIVYGQKGMPDEAKKFAALALPKAPNQEAKDRLQKFVDVMSKGPIPQAIHPGGAPATSAKSAPSLETWLRQHPIVGPKFVRIESAHGITKVYLQNFPMDAMPPFVREKFIGSLKEASQGLKGALSIREASTDQELTRIDLSAGTPPS